MNFIEVVEDWKSNDEWHFADKEAAWKFFFAAGKEAPQKVISAQCVKMNQYENIIFELRDQLAKAEQRVAEACALTYLEDYDLTDIAERVRAGEWRKFVKETRDEQINPN